MSNSQRNIQLPIMAKPTCGLVSQFRKRNRLQKGHSSNQLLGARGGDIRISHKQTRPTTQRGSGNNRFRERGESLSHGMLSSPRNGNVRWVGPQAVPVCATFITWAR